ncbi:SacI homology domain-containing protein [Pisolithus croceorrhizus]|nr:SacI homology domain-containing protein [Pisolithus croceorrhizus]
MKPLHQRLSLFVDGKDAYTFVPIEPLGAQSLTIHRATGDIVLNPPNKAIPSTATRYEKTVYGILGMISLALSEYVVIMTGREHRARFMGHDIYRAADFDILPLNPNGHLLALVRAHLFGGYFLFSYTFDLSRRLQAQWSESESDTTRPLWKQVTDPGRRTDRFFWNNPRLIDTEIAQELSPYILPTIYGSQVVSYLIQLCLISRRSRYRAGTRYFRRGIDHEGHQILLVEESLSFVQIRGSVPVFWGEINTLRYKPDLQIMDLQDTVGGCRKSGEDSSRRVTEQPVKEAYERAIAQTELPEAKYRYFDFHNECKHMRWDRINSPQYFHLNMLQAEPAVKIQKGVVRTNCMDNLDRTNVVQAALAKWTLNYQLKDLGVLTEGEELDDFQALSQDFREMWADHADLISRAYCRFWCLEDRFHAGRTNDGYKSVMRYIRNNYFDGARQDGFRSCNRAHGPHGRILFTAVSLLADTRPLIIRSVPYVASFSLFMICAGPHSTKNFRQTPDYSLLYYFTLWFVIACAIDNFHHVTWYRIRPGFRSAHHGKGLMGPWGQKFTISRKAVTANGVVHGGRKRAPTNYMEEIEKGTKSRVD